jgi:leukotriene-A4 hydrolase
MRFVLWLTAALAVSAVSYVGPSYSFGNRMAKLKSGPTAVGPHFSAANHLTRSPVTLQDVTTPANERDVHSFARPTEARVTHVALDLSADFAAHRLSGTATLTVQSSPTAREIVLDTRDLTIEAVTDLRGRSLVHRLSPPDPILGRALYVTLPDDPRRIVIRYTTSPEAPALQWLKPAQTAGGKEPYLFSQGQAILTRSWIPTQDSPGIRQTFEARIVVPKPLVALMSAEELTPNGEPSGKGRAFRFKLDRPIPPYLNALAIGDITFRPIGPRSGVYAEPSVVEKAAFEFGDVEKMMEAAEKLGGPYRWGRYDILVLPPSFPFGGMENPRLTFATPTVLAGDRSLISLVAHELAHSWSGNLVTNATWRDFWLNEGFTTYFENRIMETLYGPDRAAMLESLGRRDLLDKLATLKDKPGDQVLHLNLDGRDPDDAATPVAYEKGAAFLRMVEHTVGRDRFDTWLVGYFNRHAFTSLTTEQFLEDFRENLLDNDANLERKMQVTEWIEQPGLPANATVPTSKAFARVEAEANRFKGGTSARELNTSGWVTQQWQHFLGLLPERMRDDQLRQLDDAFGFSRTGNSEVLFGWLRIAVRHHYTPALPALEHFLTSQGRRKFLQPLYEDLMASDWGKREAVRIYAQARPFYHAVSTSTLDRIVLEAQDPASKLNR